MSHSHDTQETLQWQALDLINTHWDQTIPPLLPHGYEEMARRLGAFERKRDITCVNDLLRGVLAYSLNRHSFTSLGIWATLIGLACISANAWRKRLLQSSRWLQWMIEALLPHHAHAAPSFGIHHRLLLVDATNLKQRGGGHAKCRAHICYDWLAGKLVSVSLNSALTPEDLSHIPLSENTVVIGDRAYGHRGSFMQCADAGMHLLARITPRSFPMVDAHGNDLDVSAWLARVDGARASCQGFLSPGRAKKTGRRVAVRVIAQRISDQAAQREQQRAREQSKGHGHIITQETLDQCAWIVVATTLSADEYSDEEIMLLYRTRWQIELFFKRLKSLLEMSLLPSGSIATCEASVRACLLAWLLQEQIQDELRETLATQQEDEWLMPEREASPWALTQMSLQIVRQEVNGYWTQARVHHCLPRLRRYLFPSPRQRLLRTSLILQRFTAHLLHPPLAHQRELLSS